MKNPDRCRILYAEDNEDVGFVISVILGFSDIESVITKTAAAAWDLAQNESFDLYLLDSRFPDGSGLDLCRRLREYAPRTPIIFYSGDAHQDDRHKGILAGADAYLTKPHFDNLAEIIFKTVKLYKKSAFKSPDNFSSIAENRDAAQTENRKRP